MTQQHPSCGQNKGYVRHKRAGEDPCDPCLAAHSRYTSRWARVRRARKKGVRVLKPCGTPAAYERHRRKGEPIDDDCRRANADRVKPYNRERKRQAKRDREARLRALVLLAEAHPVEFRKIYLRMLATSPP